MLKQNNLFKVITLILAAHVHMINAEIRFDHQNGLYARVAGDRPRTPVQQELMRQQNKITDDDLVYEMLLRNPEFLALVTQRLNEVLNLIVMMNDQRSVSKRIEARIAVFHYAFGAWHGRGLDQMLHNLQKYFNERTGELINSDYDPRLSEAVQPFLQIFPDAYVNVLEKINDDASQDLINEYRESSLMRGFKNVVYFIPNVFHGLGKLFSSKPIDFTNLVRSNEYNNQLLSFIWLCKRQEFDAAQTVRNQIMSDHLYATNAIYEEYYKPHFNKNFDECGITRKHQTDFWWSCLPQEAKNKLTQNPEYREFIENILNQRKEQVVNLRKLPYLMGTTVLSDDSLAYAIVDYDNDNEVKQDKMFTERRTLEHRLMFHETELLELIHALNDNELIFVCLQWAKEIKERATKIESVPKNTINNTLKMTIFNICDHAGQLALLAQPSIAVELLYYCEALMRAYNHDNIQKSVITDITLHVAYTITKNIMNNASTHIDFDQLIKKTDPQTLVNNELLYSADILYIHQALKDLHRLYMSIKTNT